MTPSKFISLKTVIIAVCRTLTSLFSELCENARGHISILCYKSSDAKWTPWSMPLFALGERGNMTNIYSWVITENFMSLHIKNKKYMYNLFVCSWNFFLKSYNDPWQLRVIYVARDLAMKVADKSQSHSHNMNKAQSRFTIGTATFWDWGEQKSNAKKKMECILASIL